MQKEQRLVPLYRNEILCISNVQKTPLIKLVIISLLFLFSGLPLTYSSETYPVTQEIAPRSVSSKQAVESVIKELVSRHFEGEDAKIAYAIIKAESSGNIRATGYNCYYTPDGLVHETRVLGAKSTHCKKGHAQFAISTDCGLAQISFKGKECPEKAYDPEWNVAEMKRYHNTRGWSPWVAYTTKRHLAYME